MEWLGYIGALFIGIVMGLLGGGGAILSVPILVYIMNVEAGLATAYSLFVVGTTALAGSVRYWRHHEVHYKAALYFLIPSVIFVYFTRLYLVPSIPQVIRFAGMEMEKGTMLMLLFAAVMVVAGVSMIRGRIRIAKPHTSATSLAIWVSLWGTVVGFLAGLLGAGGGFMIVPVLVLFMGLPMKTAVGTSLVVIAGQSLTGFVGALQAHEEMHWPFLLQFSSFAFAGMFIGTLISRKSHPENLKKLFGYFVLLMGSVIIALELIC
jgi:uncharacterized membrane protein YfcA